MTEARRAAVDRNDIVGIVGVAMFVVGIAILAVLAPLVILAGALVVVGALLFLIAWRRA